ncbi:MAG: hypothetical protein K0A98_14250 [Trueperaceae bacterium]|nr:hypothetical protein [Trueperaceae bacterium]
MARQTGTYSLADLRENRFENVSVHDFGMDTLTQVIQNDLAAHNAQMEEMVGDLALASSDLVRIYGTGVDGQMIEVDEFGRGPTQKDLPGDTVGFPMRKYQFPIGWTRDYLDIASVQDVALTADIAEKAHLNAVRREIKKALFLSANFSFVDYAATKTTLAVKRLLNADSAAIPPGPNGESFDGTTHTHYIARASTLANSDVTALITKVVEHGHSADVRIVINQADEATMKALTSFKAYVDVRLNPSSTASDPKKQVDTLPVDNRPIGLFEGVEVWVKPWGIANYWLCWDAGSMAKPLVMRERPQATLRGLRLAGEIPTHPLLTRYMESVFGFGVWTRTNGAILYINDTTWADPTITS